MGSSFFFFENMVSVSRLFSIVIRMNVNDYFVCQIKVLISINLQDFYSVLGVSRNASKSEIKSGIYTIFYPFWQIVLWAPLVFYAFFIRSWFIFYSGFTTWLYELNAEAHHIRILHVY